MRAKSRNKSLERRGLSCDEPLDDAFAKSRCTKDPFFVAEPSQLDRALDLMAECRK